MFQHVLVICSPFNTTYHRPQFLPAKKKKKRKKTPETKLIKEENRLYVTFNLCDTSSQAFERNFPIDQSGMSIRTNLNSPSQSS